MKSLSDNSIIDEIKKEYNRIDNRWMKIHFYSFVALVLAGFVAEAIIAVLWYDSGDVLIPTTVYLVKYILSPVAANLLLIIIGTVVMYMPGIKRKVKAYVISILYVGTCLVFYTAHSIFYSLYIIFTVPILLTVIYNDYLLTSFTAVASIVSKTVSELFIVWDPDKINPASSEIGIVNLCISTFILILFYFLCIVVISFERKKNEASIQKEIEHYQTRQKLKIDELTGIYNRTALRKAFQNMAEDKTGCEYYFAMMDIDNFKALNDTFGHTQGDHCLKEFANILKKCCENNSTPFRFGGDEFCILFVGETKQSITDICKQIREHLKESPTSQKNMVMSASIGVAKYEPQMTLTQLIKNTDSMMYLAKNCCGNICFYGDDDCCK